MGVPFSGVPVASCWEWESLLRAEGVGAAFSLLLGLVGVLTEGLNRPVGDTGTSDSECLFMYMQRDERGGLPRTHQRHTF